MPDLDQISPSKFTISNTSVGPTETATSGGAYPPDATCPSPSNPPDWTLRALEPVLISGAWLLVYTFADWSVVESALRAVCTEWFLVWYGIMVRFPLGDILARPKGITFSGWTWSDVWFVEADAWIGTAVTSNTAATAGIAKIMP